MNRVMLEIVIGVVSFLAAVVVGYRSWRVRRRLGEKLAGTVSLKRRFGLLAAAPVASGFGAGMLLLAVFSSKIASNDRFYTPGSARLVALSVLAGGAVILCGELLLAAGIVAGSYPWTNRERMQRVETRAHRYRWLLDLFLETVAAVIVVGAGTRFSQISIGPEHGFVLGKWSAALTVLWLVVATNIVKLLDGLEGAANVLLLIASVAVFYVTLGVSEHFLNAFSVVVASAVLASLRFNFFPARLAMGGSGTAFVGFVFAVLTVLARQKTVAALLLFFPLVVVVLLVGGAMLTLLERTVSIGEGDKE